MTEKKRSAVGGEEQKEQQKEQQASVAGEDVTKKSAVTETSAVGGAEEKLVALAEAEGNPAQALAEGEKASAVGPIQEYLRQLVKIHNLPKVDGDGHPFIVTRPGLVGRESTKNRQSLPPARLRQYFAERYPNRPCYIVPEAYSRIKRIKPSSNSFWTRQQMKEAYIEFQVPNGLRVIILCPELFDRDLLKNDSKFVTANQGIMSPCPKCSSNKSVSHMGWTASRVRCQKSLNEQKNLDIVLAATYQCKNTISECHSLKFIEVDGKKKREQTTSEFTCYVSNWWCQYPDNVK